MQFLGVVCILCGLSLVSNANALTYQDGSDIQFTFNSTLSISLSDADIVIGNLIPGQDDTSNAVDIVVNTNNLYGYTLTATVGSVTKDYRDIRHTNGVANFASIDVDSDLTTLSGQSSSVWGYTTSTNGTTWSNYNGLPKYDDTTNTAELNVTDGAAEDSTTSFKIGAYAAEGQLAGDYTNVINFIVTSNVGKTYIQDVTSANCPTEPTIVYDIRDEEEYTIQKLADNKCWLLDNLRLDLASVPLATLKGNTNASDTALTYLKNGGAAMEDAYASEAVVEISSPLSTDSFYLYYDKPYIASSYKNTYSQYGYAGKMGILYNYCAATAGSYCFDTEDENLGSPLDDAMEDICPSGWRMPTADGSGGYSALYALYDNINEFRTVFRIAFSGYYGLDRLQNIVGYIDQDDSNIFWTSEKFDDFRMKYWSTSLNSYAALSDKRLRNYAFSVRCVAK